MKDKSIISFIYDFAEIFMSAAIVVTVVFTFAFKTSVVNGDSMNKTLSNGDTVIMNSVNNGFERGDVVIISQPNAYDKVLIKRVIATGGQVITFDQENRRILIDGVEIDEPYIKEKMVFTFSGSRYVPEGKLFVLGDNRNASADSRDPKIGFVDEKYVVGKVIYRLGDSKLFEKDKNYA